MAKKVAERKIWTEVLHQERRNNRETSSSWATHLI